MTVRDELVRVAKAVAIENIRSAERQDLEYAIRTANTFLRDHGPALVEALNDGERGKWMLDNAAWIRRDGVTVMEITLPEGVNLSSWGCRRDAIDRARGGE